MQRSAAGSLLTFTFSRGKGDVLNMCDPYKVVSSFRTFLATWKTGKIVG